MKIMNAWISMISWRPASHLQWASQTPAFWPCCSFCPHPRPCSDCSTCSWPLLRLHCCCSCCWTPGCSCWGCTSSHRWRWSYCWVRFCSCLGFSLPYFLCDCTNSERYSSSFVSTTRFHPLAPAASSCRSIGSPSIPAPLPPWCYHTWRYSYYYTSLITLRFPFGFVIPVPAMLVLDHYSHCCLPASSLNTWFIFDIRWCGCSASLFPAEVPAWSSMIEMEWEFEDVDMAVSGDEAPDHWYSWLGLCFWGVVDSHSCWFAGWLACWTYRAETEAGIEYIVDARHTAEDTIEPKQSLVMEARRFFFWFADNFAPGYGLRFAYSF